MFKKIACCFFAITCFSFFWAQNAKPIFNDYASEFNLYLGSKSSTANMITVSSRDYFLHTDIKGESCAVTDKTVTAEKIIKDFDAKLQFVESAGDILNYYCYSDNIRSCITLNGKRVNLHVSVSERGLILGSPIIFGSF